MRVGNYYDMLKRLNLRIYMRAIIIIINNNNNTKNNDIIFDINNNTISIPLHSWQCCDKSEDKCYTLM